MEEGSLNWNAARSPPPLPHFIYFLICVSIFEWLTDGENCWVFLCLEDRSLEMLKMKVLQFTDSPNSQEELLNSHKTPVGESTFNYLTPFGISI